MSLTSVIMRWFATLFVKMMKIDDNVGDNDNDKNLSHRDMVCHVVRGANIVRLPVHIHTCLLSDHISIIMMIMVMKMITILVMEILM